MEEQKLLSSFLEEVEKVTCFTMDSGVAGICVNILHIYTQFALLPTEGIIWLVPSNIDICCHSYFGDRITKYI